MTGLRRLIAKPMSLFNKQFNLLCQQRHICLTYIVCVRGSHRISLFFFLSLFIHFLLVFIFIFKIGPAIQLANAILKPISTRMNIRIRPLRNNNGNNNVYIFLCSCIR